MQRSTPEALDIVELPDEDEVETACYDGGAGVQKGKQEKGIVVIEPDDKDEGHPESPPSGTVYDKANTGTESGMMEASQNYLYEKSFYDYFGLKPDATRHLIKKAFKRQVIAFNNE